MGLSNALSVYRNLLKLAKSLPVAKRTESLQQIKDGFRNGMSESDPEKVREMLGKANSTLGYLKIVTPRSSHRTAQAGKVTLRFGEGDDLRSGARPVSNWTGSNLDPDSVRRHKQTLSRAGFKNNFHAKGVF
jgi:hypothetical protein